MRRLEDKYDLEDICKAAIQVSESSQGMFHLMGRATSANTEERGVYVFNQPVSETKALAQKLEDLEGAQALENNHLVNVNQNLDAKFSELESMKSIDWTSWRCQQGD